MESTACNAAKRIHLATSQLEDATSQLRAILEPPSSSEAALRAENARLLITLLHAHPPRPAMLPQRRLRIAARQGWTCNVCGELLSESFAVDHVTSWSETFDDGDDNRQAICHADHAQKTSIENSCRSKRGPRSA